jgi:REP element-mobilizing transposase RayT
MTANYLRLYVHLVWKTWDHLPLITAQVRELVYPVILDKAGEMHGVAHAIGGVEDHVHTLIAFPATVCVSEMAKAIKGASSHALRTALPEQFFKWQGSYGAVTVSPSALPAVIRYIENQVDHHRRNALDAELERADEPDDLVKQA